MEPYDIVDRTMDRGDAEKMSNLFGKSKEWWNSHRRQPKSEDYQNGTGNESPVTEYLDYLQKRLAANRRSATRMHDLVDSEARNRIDDAHHCANQSKPMRSIRRGLLKEATDAIRVLDECEVEDASNNDLLRWEEELAQLEREASDARAHIRAVRRERQVQRFSDVTDRTNHTPVS